jgi:hypothetical protein
MHNATCSNPITPAALYTAPQPVERLAEDPMAEASDGLPLIIFADLMAPSGSIEQTVRFQKCRVSVHEIISQKK